MEKCYYHPKTLAVTKCVGCKFMVCATCRDEGHKGLCGSCLRKKATLTDTRDSREAARERSMAAGAAPGLGGRSGAGSRSDIVYCFRHQDIRASSNCATCNRSYCPACLNSSGVCGVCARTNKDAQAMAFGLNDRGRAVMAEQEAENAKKRLQPRDYLVIAGMVLAVGVSWKLMQPKPQKDDTTAQTLKRASSNLSPSELALLASIRKERKIVLKDPPPKPLLRGGATYGGGTSTGRGYAGGNSGGYLGGKGGGSSGGGAVAAEALEIRAVEPADGTIVGGNAQIRAAIAGNPRSVVCDIDGVSIGRSSGSGPRFGWNTRAAGNGPHSVTITATNAGGTTSTSFTLNVMNR